MIIIRGKNYYPQDIEHAVSEVDEVRPGCAMAFASSGENAEEHLILAVEIKKDLINDLEMFKTYILPAVDKKVRELVLLRFQISPAERLYLKAGTISKTSSGKIKHQFNRDRFLTGHFDGLLARVSDAGEEEPEALTGIYGTVKSLFKSIVELDPEMDTPFLDQGGDSIKILEFIETLQEKYPVENEDLMDMIDEETSLNDVARWFEERL